MVSVESYEAAIERLRAENMRLRELLELPLLFHSGGTWDGDKSRRWDSITGAQSATSKIMCDCIREALKP